MKYLKLAIVSASIGFVTSAFAGAGVVTTTVTRLQDTVTYSKTGTKPLETYVGYKVTISTAGSNNTINNIRFIGTATVNGTGATSAADYFPPAQGAPCSLTSTSTTPPFQTNVECTVGQITSGSLPRDIIVFFKAPTGTGEGTASVVFSGRTYFAEGTGGVPNSTPENSISPPLSLPAATDTVTLGTTNPVNIRTALPKRNVAQTLFTGDQGNPKPNPPGLLTVFTESLTVPSLQNAATSYLTAQVEIKEAKVTDPNDPNDPNSSTGLDYSNCLTAGNFVGCPAFTTKVLDANESPFVFANADPLLFIFRVDASYLKRPPSQILNTVQLLYTGTYTYTKPDGTLGVENYVDTPVAQSCPGGQARDDGLPCIVSKFCYKVNNSVPADLRGDCEWQLKNKKNLLTKMR